MDLETAAKDLAFHKGATRGRTNLAKEHVAEYFAMVTGVDEQIGRVLQTLKDENLYDNTIVVLTSDHGEMMGSHGLMSKNIWYEEAINVPFIIRWPERLKAGQKSDLLISPTDIMPTILNMMGATKGIPSDLDGKDLSSLILDGKGDEPQSVMYYFIEEGQPASGHRGLRTKRYTYVITLDRNDVEREILFDNQEDPYQMHNIAGTATEVKAELHQELMQQLKSKKDPWLDRYNKLQQKQ